MSKAPKITESTERKPTEVESLKDEVARLEEVVRLQSFQNKQAFEGVEIQKERVESLQREVRQLQGDKKLLTDILNGFIDRILSSIDRHDDE